MLTIKTAAFTILLAALFFPPSVAAQVPDTLKLTLSISPPQDSTSIIYEHNVALDGDLLAFSTPTENIGEIRAAGGVRVFSATTGELLHVIPNPAPETKDRFGRSVALSGTRLVVGAPGKYNSSEDRRGIVYVYELAGPTPTVPALVLNCPTSIVVAEFGSSVAISGNRIAVGAPYGAPVETHWLSHGYVYLYDLSAPSPEYPWLTVYGNQPQFSKFGSSVAISGQTLVVGADRQTVASQDAGAVYIYDLADGTPSMANWVLPNPAPESQGKFGNSVGISGSRVVIGSPGYNNYTGRAYVHDLSSANPANPLQVIEAPNSGRFGWHVAIEGTRIVIGAPKDSSLGYDSWGGLGRAFVYDITHTAPGTPVAILDPGSAPYNGIESFGHSVAMSGNTIAVAERPEIPPNKCFIFTPGAASLFNHATMTAGLSGPANSTTVFPSGMTLVAGGGSISSTGWSSIGQGNGLLCQFSTSGADTTIDTGASGLLAFGFDYTNHLIDECEGIDPGYCYMGNPGSMGNPATSVHFGSSSSILSSTGGFGDGVGPGDFAFFGIVATSPSDIADGRVRFSSKLTEFGIDRFTYLVPEPGATHVTVPGTANPWLAGHPDGTTAQFGDSAPAQSPVMVANVETGKEFRFKVVGGVNHITATPIVGPDGGLNYSHPAENGVAPFNAPINSLIGVFLTDAVPASPAPAAFTYQPNSLLVSPGLHQPFFIGNGLDNEGISQRFVTPAGATRLFLGTMDGVEWNNNTGAFSVRIIEEEPEIVVILAGPLTSGSDMVDCGPMAVGTSMNLDFTISNSANADLILTGTPRVAVIGSQDFTVIAQPASPVTGPGGSSNFTVLFAPSGGSGLKTASLSIPNNDVDENPFVIHLRGIGLSNASDTDGDGLNDWAEYQMAALGFDWEVSQPDLVATLNSGANDAGFYTAAQVQALHVGKPLLQRDPVNGEFTLTIGVKKSVDLLDFDPFPVTAPQISINETGEMEVRFASPDNAAFFRLEVD